jgi:PKD repeat protein
VVGEYCSLPGGVEGCQDVGDDPDDPEPGNQSPQAEFNVMCVGLACSFDGTGSTDDGTIVSFDWDFGDDNTGTGATVEHTYAAAGTFTVTLVVTDDEGASDTGIQDVQVAGSVNAAPTAAFSVACDALTCSFTDQSTDADGSVVSWAWDFGDDGTSGDQNPVHTYAGGGDFLVELTVTDNQGVADSTSQEVTVDAGSTGISLVLEPRRVRGLHEVQLTWSGATSGQVDIHRNGSLLATVANAVGSDNAFLDRTGGRGRGTYTYQVCEAGSTAACSEQVTATFN